MAEKLTVPRVLRSWRLKSEFQRVLARLPSSVGDVVYHLLQTAKGLTPNPKRNVEFADRVTALVETATKRPLQQASVVEVGSGWFPTTPLVFLARGHARSVDTFDLNRHYSPRRIRQAATALERLIPGTRLVQDVQRTGALPASLRYHPHTDVAEASLPPETIDVAFSEFVLEHVTEDDLLRIHRASLRWMKPDAVWVHWVSPSDHRAYSDTSLHTVDFLRYSRAEWEGIAGHRFAFHNRLRRPQFRELFDRAGWKILAETSSINNRALATLPQLPLHADYADMPPEDLVAGSLWFVLGKK